LHGILTVGDMEEYVKRIPRHSGNKRCPCDKCRTARTAGCEHPGKCHKAAKKMLDSLQRKWDPRQDDLPENHDVPAEGENAKTKIQLMFNTQDNITNEFRVFTERGEYSPDPAINNPSDDPGPVQEDEVYIAVVAFDEGFESARAAGTMWYGENDDRNETHCQIGKSVTRKGCEAETMIKALQKTQPDRDLVIKTNSEFLLRTVGHNLVKFEDRGWIGIAENKNLKTLLASLRCRRGQTLLEKVTTDDPALVLSRNTAEAKATELTQASEAPDRTIPSAFQVTGARLQEMTQALLYKGILEMKKVSTRKNAAHNLGMTRGTQKEINGKEPNDEKIWNSIRSKDLSQRARAFLWKVIHNAYKCGKYWQNIPECEYRGNCHVCDVEENMEHILVECKASGQEHIWNLVQETLSLRDLKWENPSFGTVIGCCLINYKSEDGLRSLKGANRLYRILVSESAHLIWRLRCKWRISDEADPEKIPSIEEVRKTWLNIINRRLKLDCLQTDKRKYGKKAIRPSLVEKTWWGVLRNQESLPDNWLFTTGVIVGIGERPPGRNR